MMEFKRNLREMSRGLLFIIIIMTLAFLSYISIIELKGSVFDYNGLGNLTHFVIFYKFFSGIISYYGLFFAILSSFLIANDYESGHMAVVRSMKISQGKIVAGKIMFLYLLSVISLTIDFSVGFAFFHNGTTLNLAATKIDSYVIIILSFSIIVFMFILIGTLIGTIFSKRINSVIASLALVFLIEGISTFFNGFKNELMKNFYTIVVFKGNATELISHLISPFYMSSFIPVMLNFYSNQYINPNGNTNESGVTYVARILFPPQDFYYYVVYIVSYASILIISIYLAIYIKRRYT
ncbi:MAG: hypothetical protein AMDU5_GPLC00019G0029 [Thermoplasmatales archaeon Gpl]|nr:MAG: hypothetical protein AMDU5_GPLC00019G0029 [Thermoplasmatales archaeon Gpl]